MSTHSIPQSYQEWRHCITVDCGLELTPDYISDRLSSLNNNNDHHTRKFIELYGQQHLENVISWFTQARESE